MAVTSGVLMFEIIVEEVNSTVKVPNLIIKSVFADVFSLELKHSKSQLPPCLDPTFKSEPMKKAQSRIVGKTNTLNILPPNKQTMQSCQSVTFSSSSQSLIENMKKCPMALSLWNEKNNLIYMGSAVLPWDPIFIEFLQMVHRSEDPLPVCFKQESNIFQERTGSIIAKIGLRLKLTYVTNRATIGRRNCLTVEQSKTTSVTCNIKISDKNCNRCVAFTDYPNVSECNDFSNKGNCCVNYSHTSHEPIYRSPIICPDFVIDYIQKIMAPSENMTQSTDDGSQSNCRQAVEPSGELPQREKPFRVQCEENDKYASSYEDQMCLCGVPIEKVYIVYYFTVEYDFDKDPTSQEPSNSPTSKESSKSPSPKAPSSKAPSSKEGTSNPPSSDDSDDESLSNKYPTFPNCPPTCPISRLAQSTPCSKAVCGIERADKKDDSSDSKCISPECTSKLVFPPSPADSNIVIKFNEIYNPCCVKSCDISERVKEFISDSVVRHESRKKCREMEDAQDPCYCDCVCTFKFSNRTTYCCICGGYECLGDDTRDLPDYARPHPCPVYHKLYDKKQIKTKSPWPEEEVKQEQTPKISKAAKPKVVEAAVAAVKVAKTTLPEKEVKVKETVQELKKVEPKKAKKKEVGKFTANAAAQPAQGTVVKEEEKEKKKKKKKKFDFNKWAYPAVPKYMGWNWLAKDIPGLEFRPQWRPGAANKILVRRYKALMEGSDTIAKKKRALMQRKKKVEMKPTLVVTKYQGEFTVQMEVFKKYSKERLLHQYPYDEKPPLIYTIGKTEAEQNKLQRQRDRRARRETRRKSRLLQSTFRDKCQEICLKAYNQSIGLLPLPNPNCPDCPCATEAQPSMSPAIDSCSCSDEPTISSSDTDHDEWVIEFTPPLANWDAKAKHPPLTQCNESQYNYLDYKVKIFDRNGNPVPRFFTSHEGKQECSDLGGFWGPGHVWLEINKDGYIGPDERWVPMNFFGPDGMSYSAEEGSFTDNTGQILKLGVDGYIDKDLKWVWYTKKKQNKSSVTGTEKAVKHAKPANVDGSCKGKGICNAGGIGKEKSDKKTDGKADDKTKGTSQAGDKGTEKASKGKTGVKKVVVESAAKQGSSGKKNHSDKQHNPVVMNVSITRDRNKVPQMPKNRKPYVDSRKIAKYREIMAGFQTSDDFYDIKLPTKTNRASNTPRKKPTAVKTQAIRKDFESVTNMSTSVTRTINMSRSLMSSRASHKEIGYA